MPHWTFKGLQHNIYENKKRLFADMTYLLKTFYTFSCKVASPYLLNVTNKIVSKDAFFLCLLMAVLHFWFSKPPYKLKMTAHLNSSRSWPHTRTHKTTHPSFTKTHTHRRRKTRCADASMLPKNTSTEPSLWQCEHRQGARSHKARHLITAAKKNWTQTKILTFSFRGAGGKKS